MPFRLVAVLVVFLCCLAGCQTGEADPQPVMLKTGATEPLIAWSPNSQTLATASSLNGPADLRLDHTKQELKLWDVATAKEQATLGTGCYNDLRFSPDGKRLAAARAYNSGGGVRLFDVAARKEVTLLGQDAVVSSIAFSPDGKLLAAFVFEWIEQKDPAKRIEAAVVVYETDTFKERRRLPSPNTGQVRMLGFDPRGKTVIVVADNKLLVAWDVETGKVRENIKLSRGVFCAAQSPDRKLLALGGWDREGLRITGRVTIMDLTTFKEHSEIPFEGRSVVFFPNSKRLAIGHHEKNTIWNLETGKFEESNVARGTTYRAFSPDGKLAATSPFSSGGVSLVRVPQTK